MSHPSPKKLLLLTIPAVLVIAGIVLLYSFRTADKPDSEGTYSRPFPKGKTISIDYNLALFRQGVEKFPRPTTTSNQRVTGGIVPHHDLASSLIAEFFAELKKSQNPKTIIILGPNHPDTGEKVLTAKINWQTNIGTVRHNDRIISELVKNKIAAIDERRLEREQSITTLIPFIVHYFPEAELVPIIVTSKNDINADAKLAQHLSRYLNDDTLLIASIDFSHYLPSAQAARNDAEMKKYIEDRNYSAIARLNSDYLDSPPALITFLKTMDTLGAKHMEILANTNSGNLFGQDLEVSTSYFTIIFK